MSSLLGSFMSNFFFKKIKYTGLTYQVRAYLTFF
jgi:hypothetical protein